jgi:hypothetical protein
MRTRTPVAASLEDPAGAEDAPDAGVWRAVLAGVRTLRLTFLATDRFGPDAALFAAAIFERPRAINQS